MLAGAVVSLGQIVAILGVVAVVMAVSTLVLLRTMEERPAAVSQGANTLSHPIESSLQTTSSPVAPTSCTPATLRPANALGALGELVALGGARVPPREQSTTLTGLTSQGHKRRAHALLQCHAPYTVLPPPIRAS